jgi:hypothetical protein
MPPFKFRISLLRHWYSCARTALVREFLNARLARSACSAGVAMSTSSAVENPAAGLVSALYRHPGSLSHARSPRHRMPFESVHESFKTRWLRRWELAFVPLLGAYNRPVRCPTEENLVGYIGGFRTETAQAGLRSQRVEAPGPYRYSSISRTLSPAAAICASFCCSLSCRVPTSSWPMFPSSEV